MRFPVPLFPATLVRRYKRFLADVVLPSGETVTVHCANPGSMIGLDAAGARAVMLFLIQIGSARRFKLARDIDPAYGAAFDAARAMGVEAIAYRCGISCEGIEVAEPVSIEESDPYPPASSAHSRA